MTTSVLPTRGWALELRTSRLTLRVANPSELAALGGLAALGVHPDGQPSPMDGQWTSKPPLARLRYVVDQQLSAIRQWPQANWRLPLTAFLGDDPVGEQWLLGDTFGQTGIMRTRFWLGARYQNLGLGTEMRCAAIRFSFDKLNAKSIVSRTYVDNPRSLAISAKLGYIRQSTDSDLIDGVHREFHVDVLDRKTYELRNWPAVTISPLGTQWSGLEFG